MFHLSKQMRNIGLGILTGIVAAGFLGIIYVAHATPGRMTRNFLSFVGQLSGTTGSQNLLFRFRKNGTAICEPSVTATPGPTGQFSVEIPLASCPPDLLDGGDVTLDIQVGAVVVITGQPVNPVPYAKYADQASDLVPGLRSGLIPTGAVMFFNLASCPNGWTEYVAAQGRYVVGLPQGGVLAGTAGSPLGDRENRPVGQHTHSVTDPGHSHNLPRALNSTNNNCVYGLGSACDFIIGTGASRTNISIDNAGTIAGTNAPYVQLLACQKM